MDAAAAVALVVCFQTHARIHTDMRWQIRYRDPALEEIKDERTEEERERRRRTGSRKDRITKKYSYACST